MPLKKQEIAHQLACAHFIQMYELASVKAQGGANWDKVRGMTLEAFMDMYAPNGLRLEFKADWHIDHYMLEVDRILPNIPAWPPEVEAMAEPAHVPDTYLAAPEALPHEEPQR